MHFYSEQLSCNSRALFLLKGLFLHDKLKKNQHACSHILFWTETYNYLANMTQID